MSQQVPVEASARADLHQDGKLSIVAPDLAYERLAIVNAVFYGRPGASDRGWLLIDAGIPGMAERIHSAAAERFGANTRPAAIILTHGHFDHVGSLKSLAEDWDAPIYAHELELPYLDGRSAYPPPDPTVGGGLMALFSSLYPKGPIDVSHRLVTLPPDGSVPFMEGWRWIHTPGHTPGHISLWREHDRTLVAGDAFITTSQESAVAVAAQLPEIHGPPMYYTPDWESSRTSVQKLAALEPELVVTGHGPAMRGPEMRRALQILASEFDEVAVPRQGRYVGAPAQANESGVTSIPPKK
jgi:glyoxylase-like metal-dependent hydrolase (beta-lactamase superfamily II)